MRNKFSEWYPLTEEERQEVLAQGTFVFDSSALLTLYRVSTDDRRRVLDLMEALQERLWIPYRVGFEFHRNRLDVVHEQLDAYAGLQKEIHSLKNKIESHKRHPVLSLTNIQREVVDRLNRLEAYIGEARDTFHPADISDPLHEDGILSAVTRLFQDRVGDETELTADVLKLAKQRFDAKIPPAFEDKHKPEPDRYGDYLVWSETLAHLKRPLTDTPHPLMLITEETKADWWLLRQPGKKQVGPRPELIREATANNVKPFWMLSLRRFFTAGASYLEWENTELGGFASVSETEPDASLERGATASTIVAELASDEG